MPGLSVHKLIGLMQWPQRTPVGCRRRLGSPFLLSLATLLLLAATGPVQGADLNEGRKLFRSGSYWECIESATAAIEQTPWIETWWKLKIESQLQVGQYAAALQTVENGLKRFNTSIQLRWLGQQLYRRNGMPEKALEMVTSIGELANQTPWRYSDATNRVILGHFFLLQGADPRQVLELAYDRAKKDQPQLVDSWIASAELALDKQDFSLALESLKEAAKLAADDPQVHYLTARALAPSDPVRATQSLEQAFKLNPLH